MVLVLPVRRNVAKGSYVTQCLYADLFSWLISPGSLPYIRELQAFAFIQVPYARAGVLLWDVRLLAHSSRGSS